MKTKSEQELNDWWSRLTIAEKEHIASKAERYLVKYPECTDVWNGLSAKEKQSIYEHVTNKHKFEANKDKEGQTMSY